jgi:DNA-binding transcriptional regulator LsrR (DeoR family)
MFVVGSYAAVRRFVFVEGHSRREASRVFGLSRETVSKMCRFSLPPGYTRTKPVGNPYTLIENAAADMEMAPIGAISMSAPQPCRWPGFT